MVGSAVMRRLENEGYTNLVTADSKELNLTNQLAVQQFFDKEKPEIVILAAAKVLEAPVSIQKFVPSQ